LFDAFQQTLAGKLKLSGIGLHSGSLVELEIRPAPANTGIVFERSDLQRAHSIDAIAENVIDTKLSTSIGRARVSVSTVEHLMAALAGLGVDNAVVSVGGPEVPIMDGSSKVFVESLLRVGLVRQNARRHVRYVKSEFEFREGEKFIRVEPSRNFRVTCSIDFSDSIIGYQQITWEYSLGSFLELAEARTFCHERDVEIMKRHGLAKGGSLLNAVVVSDRGVLNAEGLRSANEFVQHKLLDFIGDLSLAGLPLIGSYTIHKSGHDINYKFLSSLLEQSDRLLASKYTSQQDKEAANVVIPALVYA